MWFLNKDKKYYIEYLKQCGWGVMLGYYTIIAKNRKDAQRNLPSSIYGSEVDSIIKVKKDHLHFTDEQLSKIYGRKEV
jgi:hypothetical protein